MSTLLRAHCPQAQPPAFLWCCAISTFVTPSWRLKVAEVGRNNRSLWHTPSERLGSWACRTPFFTPPLLLARQVGVEDAVGLDAVRGRGGKAPSARQRVLNPVATPRHLDSAILIVPRWQRGDTAEPFAIGAGQRSQTLAQHLVFTHRSAPTSTAHPCEAARGKGKQPALATSRALPPAACPA